MGKEITDSLQICHLKKFHVKHIYVNEKQIKNEEAFRRR